MCHVKNVKTWKREHFVQFLANFLIYVFLCEWHIQKTVDSYNYCKFVDYDTIQSYNQNNCENWNICVLVCVCVCVCVCMCVCVCVCVCMSYHWCLYTLRSFYHIQCSPYALPIMLTLATLVSTYYALACNATHWVETCTTCLILRGLNGSSYISLCPFAKKVFKKISSLHQQRFFWNVDTINGI